MILRPFYIVLGWLNEEVFKRVLVNTSWLLFAKIVAAIFELIAVAIAARVLGPVGYGTFVLVLAYGETVGKFTNFQAWQAMVKFGSDALSIKNQDGLQQLFKFGYLLDVGSSIIGFIIAVTCSSFVIILFGWDQSMKPILLIYSSVILFNITGTPTGVLRLFNRFDLLSYSSIISGLLRVIGAVWCLSTNQEIFGFVITYLITGVLSQLYLVIASVFIIRKSGYKNFYKVSLHGIRGIFPGVWKFVISTNLNTTVRLGTTSIDLFVVGLFASVEMVGVFRLAKSMGAILSIPFDPIYHAIYPEMTHHWSQKRYSQLITLMKRTTYVATFGSISLVALFALVGPFALRLVYGVEFLEYGLYVTTLVYLIAVAIGMIGLTLNPLVLAMNLPAAVLKLNFVVTLGYLLLLLPTVLVGQAVGAAISYLLFMITSIFGRFQIVKKGWSYDLQLSNIFPLNK